MKRKKVVNNCFMLTILLVFIFLCVIMLRNRMVQARESVQYEKTFQSIEIESGTTLTSIAQEYSISDYDNYIEEVKKINNLHDDTIHAGCYLMIPVYVER